jgi:hypothetical protein
MLNCWRHVSLDHLSIPSGPQGIEWFQYMYPLPSGSLITMIPVLILPEYSYNDLDFGCGARRDSATLSDIHGWSKATKFYTGSYLLGSLSVPAIVILKSSNGRHRQ